MPSLRELQLHFASHIYDRNPPDDLPALILSKGIAAGNRLGIYRNNTLTGLSKALAAAYPVIERLVGTDFFRHMAHEYIRRHPSRSGDLADYGMIFPEFLADFEPCRKLVYLPDVARLEQAFNHAYRAAGHPPLATGELAQVAPERYGSLHFHMHPSARLLHSAYPVAQIWEFNQADCTDEQQIDINSGGCQLLVYRPQLAVKIVPLETGEYALLSALTAGSNFGDACEQALNAQEDANVAAIFQRHVAQHTVVSFTC